MTRSRAISVTDVAMSLSALLLMLGVTQACCIGMRTARSYGQGKNMNQNDGNSILTRAITETTASAGN